MRLRSTPGCPGYFKIWYKDIGARVKPVDRLAEIDTPDLDQQLAQAKRIWPA